jgi:hypothetical protein
MCGARILSLRGSERYERFLVGESRIVNATTAEDVVLVGAH